MNVSNDGKIFTKSFFLIFGALLFTALVMYALMSTVTEYATSLGSTATVAGLVSGIYIFGGLCSRIYSGNALEKIGWKKTALIFMGIHFLSCLLYFLVNDSNLLDSNLFVWINDEFKYSRYFILFINFELILSSFSDSIFLLIVII